MKGFEVAIAVAVCIVALTFAARRLSTPRPIVLAAGGLALGAISVAIPGFPRLTIDPHLILALVLPPLLLVAAFRSVPSAAACAPSRCWRSVSCWSRWHLSR